MYVWWCDCFFADKPKPVTSKSFTKGRISLQMERRQSFCLRFQYCVNDHAINSSLHLYLYKATTVGVKVSDVDWNPFVFVEECPNSPKMMCKKYCFKGMPSCNEGWCADSKKKEIYFHIGPRRSCTGECANRKGMCSCDFECIKDGM